MHPSTHEYYASDTLELSAAPSLPAVTPGKPSPLGVTLDDTGANIAVWAPEAISVEFCRFSETGEEERIALPYQEAGVWCAHIAGISEGTRYGLRADGPFHPESGALFNVNKLLLDPYARAVEAPLRWDPTMVGCVENAEGVCVIDERDSAPVVPKGVVTAPGSDPNPALNRPGHRLEDLVIYETHVKGLTASHPEVPEDLRGTYAGMAHPAVIDHLSTLGVNAVELLPLQAFLDDEFLVQQGRSNYWGYQPIAWCAPEPRYALKDADAELRHLVHSLHEADIEVILDVVYNHTGEGDGRGPTLSLRGLHNTGYYRLLAEGKTYVNDSGTGNTLAVEQPMTLRLVLDSLRHWVSHYGIDGFRFDLASTLGRTAEGFDPAAAFFQAVQQDPLLSQVKLIAEPWDVGPGGYQLGSFPAPWSEWNDRFRDDVRRAWRGETEGKAAIGSRLLGSAGEFEQSGRASSASINFITVHDGLTLNDVVSYSKKHNEANGEDGRDGHNENHSDNLGVEGPTDDPQILRKRTHRVRAMLATLLLSQGVPMLLAGDELGNSQSGNNNVYAQDNEIGWLDWSKQDPQLIELVSRLIGLRRRFPVLRQKSFLHGAERADGHPDVLWYREDGETPTYEDWHDPQSSTIAAVLRGAAQDPQGEQIQDVLFLVLNLGAEADVVLPVIEDGGGWDLEIDTARLENSGPADRTYAAAAQSVLVFSACDQESAIRR